ncbi:MAG TPA: winged helix-turn-helix transcriptional regulator [Candidatus Thermoplasmatota archaeon]|nr:winged helix-turn-helix transcriptional regulator [Candidatus Thermoplasmatota archaeon]
MVGRSLRRTGWTVALALLTMIALVGPAGAQTGSGRATLSGPIELAQDLVVGSGETLVIAPGATLTGPGALVVHGVLVMDGTAQKPITSAVQVRLLSHAAETSTIRHTRFFDVPGDAVVLLEGALVIEHARFEGAGSGVRATPTETSTLTITDSLFSTLAGHAVALAGPIEATLASNVFDGNGRGLVATLDAPGAIVARGSTFERNGQDVTATVAAATGGGATLLLADNVFKGIRATDLGVSRDHAAISVQSDLRAPAGASAPAAEVRLVNNLIAANPIGVHLSGAGFRFASDRDVYAGNAIGLSAYLSQGAVANATFTSTKYDLHLPGPATALAIRDSAFDPSKVHVEGQGVAVTDIAGEIRAVVVATAVTGGALATLFITLTDAGRQLAFRVALPFYTRIQANDLLAHDKRRKILDYIAANPGIHMRRIGRALELSYGTLSYHLYRLEREGILTTQESGLFKRYYTAAGRPREAAREAPPVAALRKIERDVFEDIAANPGSTQARIAERLGLSRQALHYHIKKLERMGYISKVAQGRETYCYPKSPDGAPLLGDAGQAPRLHSDEPTPAPPAALPRPAQKNEDA